MTSASRTAALALLGRRDYTIAELRQRLLDKGFETGEIHDTLERLQADGLLDDRRVAEAFVRTASRIKGRGRHRISRELQARGIDRSLAADLTARITPEEERAAIEGLLTRRRLPAELTPTDRRRLHAHLLRRGFSADVIHEALRSRGKSSDD